MKKWVAFRDLKELANKGFTPTGDSCKKKIEAELADCGNYRPKCDWMGQVWCHGDIITHVNRLSPRI
jgi:hypothetical protein